MQRSEYIILAVLFIAALLAFPAFRNVQLIEGFVLSICGGAGLH